MFYGGGPLASIMASFILHSDATWLISGIAHFPHGDWFHRVDSFGSALAFWAIGFTVIPLIPMKYKRGPDSDGLYILYYLYQMCKKR